MSNPTDAASAFASVDTSNLQTHYLDVGLAPTANQTIDPSTLGTGDFTFTQGGSSVPVAIDGSLAPTLIPGTSIHRYYVTGTFPDGKIDVTFPAGAFGDTADVPSAASTGSFTVIEPQTTVVAPFNGSSIDVAVANAARDGSGGPLYVDLMVTPPTGTTLDYQSLYTAFANGQGPTVTLADSSTPALLMPVPISMVADSDHRRPGRAGVHAARRGRRRRDALRRRSDGAPEREHHPLPLRLRRRDDELRARHRHRRGAVRRLEGLERGLRAGPVDELRRARPDGADHPAVRRLRGRRQHAQRPHVPRPDADRARRHHDRLGRRHLDDADLHALRAPASARSPSTRRRRRRSSPARARRPGPSATGSPAATRPAAPSPPAASPSRSCPAGRRSPPTSARRAA